MDIFSHLFALKIVMCVWKDENNIKKRPGFAHFYWKKAPWKKVFQTTDGVFRIDSVYIRTRNILYTERAQRQMSQKEVSRKYYLGIIEIVVYT